MKFIAIGELMLRLSPPNYEKIVTTHDFHSRINANTTK
jgi:2-dehydro-3-deoxygluconokinase